MLRAKRGGLMVSGHRGAQGYAPENTMASFRKARETGADIIEFDVHLSKDGYCVIIHDELLDRTTNGTGYVKDHSWVELSRLDAGSWFDRKNAALLMALETNPPPPDTLTLPIATEKFAGEKIPLLEEVLQWAKSVRLPVSIELKSPWPFYHGFDFYPGLVEKVLDQVARYGDEEMTNLHSFNHFLVRQVKELNPNLSTLVSVGGAGYIDPLAPVRTAKANGMAIGALWITPELVEAAHAEDIHVFGYGFGESPFNEAEQLRRLVGMGVDFVSGGFPDLLRQVVGPAL